MGAEYSRRNFACGSHHKVPEGWQSWGGNMSGWMTRPYCWDVVGHVGPHHAQISPVAEGFAASKRMEWENTLGMPKWLIDTTIHGLAMLAAHNDIPSTNSISLEVLNALLQAERRGT